MNEQKLTFPIGTKIETSIIDNQLVVVITPEKVEFKPQIGDIIAQDNKDWEYPIIAFFNGRFGKGSTTGLDYTGVLLIEDICLHDNRPNFYRLATELERQQLFYALKENNLKWNAETKQVEKIRWRAENDCKYWIIDHSENSGILEYTEDWTSIDDNYYNSGNYFQTKEQAQSAFEMTRDNLLKL